MSIKAYAALSGGKFLTEQETLEMFGRQITGRYYNGSEYVDMIFYYNTVDAIGEIYADYNYSGDIVSRGTTGLIYTANNISVNTNPQYITFDLHPEISLLNTEQIHTVIGLSGGGSISNTVYSPPRWEWVINGLNTVYQAQGGAGLSYPQYWPSFQGFGQYYYSFVRADYSANSAISGYSLRASFYGNSVSGGNYLLFVACPYVSSNATGQNGTLPAVTTSSPSSTTIINVDVDMTETNSILDNILSGIGGLVNGVKGLFIPDSEDITDFKDDIADILDDTFSGYTDAQDYIEDMREILVDPAPSAVIQFPAINIPYGGGKVFHVDSQTVDCAYNNEHMETIRTIIDILFTLWLINMILNKHHAILVGEKSVEIEGVDDE